MPPLVIPPDYPKFRPGSKLVSFRHLSLNPAEQPPLSENDKATLRAVKPLHGKADLQLKTMVKTMIYFNDPYPTN